MKVRFGDDASSEANPWIELSRIISSVVINLRKAGFGRFYCGDKVATCKPQVGEIAERGRPSCRIGVGLLLGQPATGMLTTLFGGRPFPLFFWQISPFMPRDEMLQAAVHFSHELGAWALAALAVGHTAVALFHHFVFRDDVLECMAPVIARARPKQELGTDYIVRAQNTFRE